MIENLKLPTTLNERFRGYLPVVVDVESAGFDPKNNALLEIGAYFIKLNDQNQFVLDGSLNYHIKPFEGSLINSESIKFIGIDPFDPKREAIDEAIAIKDFCKEVSKKVKEHKCVRAIMVAHNAHFDHSFILNAAERNHIKRCPFHPFSTIDTATLSATMLAHTVLAKACDLTQIPYDQDKAHGALYDAEVTAKLFCNLLNSYNNLKDFYQEQHGKN